MQLASSTPLLKYFRQLTKNRSVCKFAGMLSFAVMILTASPSFAKDLTNRVGLGFKNQFGVDLPGVAAQYYPSKELGVAAVVGIDTQKNSSKFGATGKIFRIIFEEDRMNFYMGASAGLLSQELAGVNNSGFELGGYAGGEFFFQGLDSLGFSFELGVGITSLADGVRFRTVGDSPVRAGIIFYL